MAGDTRSPRARVSAAERERQIYELRLRGAPFEDIAHQFQMTASGVWHAYQRALDRIPEPVAVLARKEQKERLDRARTKLWPILAATTEPIVVARLIREVVRLEQRESKLLGLDVDIRRGPTDVTEENSGPKRAAFQKAHDDYATLLEMMPDEDRTQFLEILERANERIEQSRAQHDQRDRNRRCLLRPKK